MTPTTTISTTITMVPVAFTILSAAATAFLTYVFAQFRRELAHLRRRTAGGAVPTRAKVLQIEAALKTARVSCHARDGQRTEHEAVMRKEVLAGAVVGLAALFAPFIFVLLLHSPWLR